MVNKIKVWPGATLATLRSGDGEVKEITDTYLCLRLGDGALGYYTPSGYYCGPEKTDIPHPTDDANWKRDNGRDLLGPWELDNNYIDEEILG